MILRKILNCLYFVRYLLLVVLLSMVLVSNITADEFRICQSCGIPLSDNYGTEANGRLSKDYCIFCYKNGKFTKDVSMDEFIEICLESTENMPKDDTRKLFKQTFPQLKRWSNNK